MLFSLSDLWVCLVDGKFRDWDAIFVGLTLSFSPESNGQCLFLDLTKVFLFWMNDFEMVVYLDFGGFFGGCRPLQRLCCQLSVT